MNSAFDYTDKSVEESIATLGVSVTDGLGTQEASKRLKQYGYNLLPEQSVYWWQLLRKLCFSPLVLLFCTLAIFYFLVGEFFNGLIILFFVLINIGLSFYQEYHANQALSLLRQYLISYITVLRDGQELRIKTSDVVLGDIVYLYAGDIVPADLRIIETYNLMIDQSSLTGESVPQRKESQPTAQKVTTIFDAMNLCFAGTLVTAGHGKGLVIATGENTAFGGIAHLNMKTIHESNLVKGSEQITKFIIKIALVTISLFLIINTIIKGFKVNFLSLFVFITALGVTIIPEAFPVVIIFCLTIGASRLIKQKVLVKRLAAIEDLGSMEVLCTDKTGTITENQMTVVEIDSKDPEKTVLYALACVAQQITKKFTFKGFEGALWSYASPETHERLRRFKKIDELPFDQIRRRNAILVFDEEQYFFIVRGSALDVLKICTPDQSAYQARLQWISTQENQGRRVLAVAFKNLDAHHKDLALEENELTCVGLIAFVDPLKKSTIGAVQKAKRLGVIIKILSGDSAQVCGAIGKEINLISDPSEVITGDFFAQQSEEKKEELASSNAVFARVLPEQKYEIVRLLQRTKRVGYLGDGINDAPALGVAHVSIAVQESADVARTAADIILIKKSLSVIIDGIEEGRRVVINTLKYITITISGTFGNFYAMTFSSLFIDYLPMIPLQILLLNLLSDFPMIAISTDTVDSHDLLKPRMYEVKKIIPIAVLLALVSNMLDIVCFLLFVPQGPSVLRTCWFIENLLTAMVLIVCLRTSRFVFLSRPPSCILFVLIVATALIAVTLPYIAVGQVWFKFIPVSMQYLTWVFGLTIIYFIATESAKLLYYRLINNWR